MPCTLTFLPPSPRLETTLAACRAAYNLLMAERERVRAQEGRDLRFKQLSKLLPVLKQRHPELAEVHARVLQDVAWRVDAAYRQFFAGRAPYPRPSISARDYTTFTYYGGAIRQVPGGVKLGKLGIVLEGEWERVKSVTVERRGEKWRAKIETKEIPT